MAQSQGPDVVVRLRNCQNPTETAAALRNIKNEIIGHVKKKELYISAGILQFLVAICATSWDDQPSSSSSRSLSSIDETRLLALQLISSFAQGGAPFLKPLSESSAIDAVFAYISPHKGPPELVQAALSALLNVADAAATVKPSECIDTAWLADEAFLNPPRTRIDLFADLLAPQQSTQATERQIHDVALLITKLCRNEQHQSILAESDVLDNLAANIAGVVVQMGYVVPGAEVWGQSNCLASCIPRPAPSDANLCVLLEAISCVVGESRFASYKFLHCPAIMAIFPNLEFDPGSEVRATFKSLQLAGLGDAHSQRLSAMDYILPTVPVPRTKYGVPNISTYPPLGPKPSPFWDRANGKFTASTASKAPSIWSASRLDTGFTVDMGAEEMESPAVPWLIHLVRARQGREKLAAASLLSCLCKSGFVGRQRETSIGTLVIPPLLSLLDDMDGSVAQEVASVDRQVAEMWEIIELIPLVLGRLATDSEILQKAACDANAIKAISKLFKGSYEPLPDVSSLQAWSPTPEMPDGNPISDAGTFCRLGACGQFPLLIHRTKVRESCLKAIGALAARRDEYRKGFVEQDVLPFVTESLNHIPEEPVMTKERGDADAPIRPLEDAPENPSYGLNPASVIIASCHVIRTFSRSVSIVRTSLLDNAVGVPLYKLMRHRSLEIQIAATSAICNLVTEVAPMRDDLAKYGLMGILCEHAQSQNASLRLNALWALKHFVNGIPSRLKKSCFDCLGSGWLVKLVCDDTEDEAVFGKTDKHMTDDLDEEMEDQPTDSWRTGSGSYRSRTTDQARLFRHIDSRLSALREAEKNPLRKARADDLAVQEQGLDFIRNLIGGGESSMSSTNEVADATAMIDYIFQEIGSDRLFFILLSKLTTKVLHGFQHHRRSVGADVSESATRLLTPNPKIVSAAIMILVHISGSLPRYRQMIIAQQDLLKQLLEQFNVKDKDVRLALCYLVLNLTWHDDGEDATGPRQRIHELKKLGFYSKLESLEAEDAELDERARALYIMEELRRKADSDATARLELDFQARAFVEAVREHETLSHRAAGEVTIGETSSQPTNLPNGEDGDLGSDEFAAVVVRTDRI
ncbi:armadillo repeat protein [Zalerion maritima]|uniref:Armadillo repeat protein n=1 Tax=Zalerion maritima TaxID=339359 RepID=A0AAD5RF21_9PEZI|nr:armadillo repeat protein [Zalerion maritima]